MSLILKKKKDEQQDKRGLFKKELEQVEANKLILQSMTRREENQADLTEELSLKMGHS